MTHTIVFLAGLVLGALTMLACLVSLAAHHEKREEGVTPAPVSIVPENIRWGGKQQP